MRCFALICVVALLMIAPASEAVETRWIPAAASNTGLHGSLWTTDLWLYSQVNDQEMVVTATFYTDQMGTPEPVQATITLPPNASVEIPDAVATLFDEHRPGSIRLEADHPFFARSRTSNTGGDTGTYGQGIPAYTQEDTATGYSLLGAANRPGADGVRTNIGITNTSTIDQTLNIIARNPDTLEELGSTAVEIGPFGWYQRDLFELLGIDDQTINLADVSVYPTSGAMVYISRVDNRSGDGTFIYGSSGPSVSVGNQDPRRLWVRTTLTYDEGVTVYWFKWFGEDRWLWGRGPRSGFTTDPVLIELPRNYCVKVIGQSGPTLTKATVSIQSRQTGGEWDGGHLSYGTTGNGPIDKEFCKQFD